MAAFVYPDQDQTASPREVRAPWNAGMTLVELMVAIGITAIIMGMSVLVFQRQYSSYRSGHAVKTAQTDVQKSLELIKDEFASAGWSVKPEMAFFFRDGGNNTADDLYLNNTSLIYVGDNDTQAERELILMVDSDCGGCMLYSGKNPINGLDIDGDGADDLDGVPVLVLQDTQVYNDSTSGTGALATTPAGTVERWVTPAIHYCVDDGVNCHPAGSENTNVLRRETDSGGRVTFAENVVDLQVVYMDDSNATYGESGCTGGACQMSPFEASRIRWVEVTFVTRSADRVRSRTDATSCRPAVGNRQGAAIGSAECGYEYRTYTARLSTFNTIR